MLMIRCRRRFDSCFRRFLSIYMSPLFDYADAMLTLLLY